MRRYWICTAIQGDALLIFHQTVLRFRHKTFQIFKRTSKKKQMEYMLVFYQPSQIDADAFTREKYVAIAGHNPAVGLGGAVEVPLYEGYR